MRINGAPGKMGSIEPERADDDQHAGGNPEHDRDGFHEPPLLTPLSAAALI